MHKKAALYSIPSSDPLLLEKASRIACEFAQPYRRDEMVGIVFLGAIPRGYFDAAADIDIALFKKKEADISFASQFFKVEGIEIHCHLANYEDESAEPWDMAKRWTYGDGQIYYDPQGKIAALLAEKVPLGAEEKKWLLMSGLALSEWYINRLTNLWVERGNLTSAHQIFSQGLNFFFDMLFALNDQLVPDMKWRYYCAEKLERLPADFTARIHKILLLHAISLEELDRRQRVFMEMWREMVPIVESEVGMPYEVFSQLV